MSTSFEKKKKFLSNFQEKIIQSRKLLKNANHSWASKLLLDLYFDIERSEWLDVQKKHQLIMIISNSWWLYLNSLSHQKTLGYELDLIRYIDAYKRFFAFLSRLEDFYLFDNFYTKLLKSFITSEDLSVDGITKFINSFCHNISQEENYLKLVELQLLLMYLRKSVIPTEYFQTSMEYLGRVIFKLEPGKRSLFLYNILESVNVKYNLMKDSEEFIKEMNKIFVNRIPIYLKETFGNLTRVSINERTFDNIIVDLEDLVYYLNDINEYSWIIIIIRNLYSNLKKYRTHEEGIKNLRKYVDFCVDRNRFEIAFGIYDFLEDIFLHKTDLSYDNNLIELWVEACKKFVDKKEKKYLLQSLEKLNNHLQTPQEPSQIFHYFYTCNYQWKFKSMFFSLEKKDFWRMMFYRALFEEKNITLAQKIIPFLGKNIRPLLSNLDQLIEQSEPLKNEIYSFEDKETILIDPEFDIEHISLKINQVGKIFYQINSTKDSFIENSIKDEYWNDSQILEIYNELFSLTEKTGKYNFNLIDFGKLLYLFLPKQIRNFIKNIKINRLDYIPYIYFILEDMIIPFEMIYENNLFLLKYACGYKIGDISIPSLDFGEKISSNTREMPPSLKKPNVLIIDSINALNPKKWDENQKRKELIYPFKAGANELEYIIEYFSNSQKIDKITILSGIKSTRENILEYIKNSDIKLIHIVGNIFYSKWSPKDSYFLTNDNEIVKFKEIFDAIKENQKISKPFLFLNTQIYDMEGNKLKDTLKSFGEIISYFEFDSIMGIICRSYPIFNDETKKLIAYFYDNLLDGTSQGVALLKARQNIIAEETAKNVEKKIENMPENKVQHINLKTSLVLSSYILFGKPWKTLNQN